jgi:hypothetical protein
VAVTLPDVTDDARTVRASRWRRVEARTWVLQWHITRDMPSAGAAMAKMGAVSLDTAAAVRGFAVELELDDLWRNA